MKHKRKICSLAFLLSVSILCSSHVHATAIQDQIDNTGEKIDELEHALDQEGQKISAYEKEKQSMEAEIASGQEKISRLSKELDDTKAAAVHTQEEIEKTQKALRQSQADSKKQYGQMKQRIRFLYENSSMDMLTYILEAGSMPEALRRVNYFQAVMSYDREKLDEFKATTNKIKQAKKDLVTQKAELETLESRQTQKLEEIHTAISGLKSRLGSKLAQIQSSQELLARYEQDLQQQKQYEQELERQKAEEDLRRAEEIRKQEEELKRKREEERRRQQEEQERKEREAQARQEQERQEQERRQQQSSSADSGPPGSTGSSLGSSSDGSSAGSAAASAGDLELLSTIIYCEAGNQSYEGQLAVGSVIMNRVASSSFPNSISGVIYQSGQFSPVASGRFAHALAAGLGSRCESAAQAVLNGERNVDCLYFRIDHGVIDGLVIGEHVFY